LAWVLNAAPSGPIFQENRSARNTRKGAGPGELRRNHSEIPAEIHLGRLTHPLGEIQLESFWKFTGPIFGQGVFFRFNGVESPHAGGLPKPGYYLEI
jgi:hypothetical protein